MQQRRNGQHPLVHALLASSLFATTMVHGNTYGPGTTVGPVASSATVDNVIQVLDSGQIKSTGANNAVELDTQDAKLIIDPNNFYVGTDAVFANGNGVNGVGVLMSAANTSVTVGADSGIHTGTGGTTDAILATGMMPQIQNAGTITSDNKSAIRIDVNVSEPLITQSVGAISQNSSSPANSAATIQVNLGGSSLVIENAGIIQSFNGQDSINLNAPFTEINNQFAGQILTRQANFGGNSNIDVTPNSGGGNIVLDVGSVMANYNTNSGTFSNIQVGLATQVSMHDITNAGLMLVEYSGTNILLQDESDTNLIQNSGLITNDNDNFSPAIQLDTTATVNTLRNSGVIYAAGQGTILGNGIVNIFNDGIFNTGHILTGQVLLTPDVLANLGSASIFQENGLILGNTLIINDKSPNADSVLSLSGGVISGDFQSLIDNVTGSPQTFNLSGGTFTGRIRLLRDNENIFNLSGSRVNSIINDSSTSNTTNTLHISGGRLNLFSDLESSTTNIYIEDSFSSGVINYFTTINVVNPGTVFRIDAPILYETMPLNPSTINTDPNTTTILHAPILHGDDENTDWNININNAGKFVVEEDQIIQLSNSESFTFVNNGILSIDSNSSLMITAGTNENDFQSLSGSTYEVGVHGPLGGPVDYGHIVLYTQTNDGESAALFATGSTIVPSFTGFLPNNTEMNIFNVNSSSAWNFPVVTDNSVLKQPPSAVIFFTKSLSDYDQDILLTSHRRTYRSLSSSAATFGVSGALDVLAQGSGPTDPDLYYLLSQLDQLPTQESLEHAMQSLAPPFNNGVQAGSHLAMKAIFNNVSDRIWDFSYPYRFTQTGRERTYPWDVFGFNGGDQNTKPFGVWLNPIGVYAEQGSRENVPGYRARGLGGIIGVDWQRDNCTLLGFAGSYVKMSVADRNIFPKDEAIQSWQGTFYGSFEYVYGIYLDAIVGIGHNHYALNRVISANHLNTAANATFSGVQWSVQTDFGMVLPSDSMWLVAPFVRLQYLNLQWGDYTEVGAGDINLAVTNSSPTNFMGGIGVRFATAIPYGCCDLIPDVTILLGNDFQQDAAPSSAYFIGGGPLFVTPNALPRRTIIDLGVGFNILTATDSILTFKYDLELRSQYYAHTFNLQYYFPWS